MTALRRRVSVAGDPLRAGFCQPDSPEAVVPQPKPAGSPNGFGARSGE